MSRDVIREIEQDGGQVDEQRDEGEGDQEDEHRDEAGR
jgi:hypothetical protein